MRGDAVTLITNDVVSEWDAVVPAVECSDCTGDGVCSATGCVGVCSSSIACFIDKEGGSSRAAAACEACGVVVYVGTERSNVDEAEVCHELSVHGTAEGVVVAVVLAVESHVCGAFSTSEGESGVG